MAVDGFAVKTTISQIGNAARSQLKSQGPAAAHNLDKQIDQKDNRIARVQQSEEAAKVGVDPDAAKDRNKKRDGETENASADSETSQDSSDETNRDADGLGLMVDLKA